MPAVLRHPSDGFSKRAKPNASLPGMYDLPDGRTVDADTAWAEGHVVYGGSLDGKPVRHRPGWEPEATWRRRGGPHAGAPYSREDLAHRAQLAYADEILALPEAAARPSAARKIVMAYTAGTMPPERAAGFLRGLPLEVAADGRPAAPPPPRVEAERFRRAVELRVIALGQRDPVDGGARREAKLLRFALGATARDPGALAAKLDELGIDPSTIRGARLT